MTSNNRVERIVHSECNDVDQNDGIASSYESDIISIVPSNNINKNNCHYLDYKDQIRERNRAQIHLTEAHHVSNYNIHRNNINGPSFKDQVTSARMTPQKTYTNTPARHSEKGKNNCNRSARPCQHDGVESSEKLDVSDDGNSLGNNVKQVQNDLFLQLNNTNLDQAGDYFITPIHEEESVVTRNDIAAGNTILTISTGGSDINARETQNENDSFHFVMAYEVTPDKPVIFAERVKTNFVIRFFQEHPWFATFIILLVTSLIVFLAIVVLVTNNNHKKISAASVLNVGEMKPSIGETATITPTMTPTGEDYVRCFESSDELRDAVISYLSDDNNTVQNMYGDTIGLWCVSKVQDFSYLFNTDTNGAFRNPFGEKFNEDISQWNTSSATTMEGMFQGAMLFDRDISRWDVSSVESMERMFFTAVSFNQNLSEWNISSVKFMSKMFLGAGSFNGDISTWDTTNVIMMDDMFLSASTFTGDLSKWNVGRVQDTSGMFAHALEFNSDISSWNMTKVTNSEAMFYNAAKFNQDISRWDVSSVEMMVMMFQEANSFNQDISRWNVSKVKQTYNMFLNTTNFNVSLCSWGLLLPKDTDMHTMFGNAVGCPNMNDPDVTRNPPGPFCHTCL